MFLLDRIMYEQTQIVSEFEQIVNQLDFLLNSFNKDYKDLPQFFGINIWNIQNDLPRIKNIIQAEEQFVFVHT